MMASLGARAARNHEARKRLNAALAALSERLDIAAPDEPRRMRDAALQPIVELERFADFAERVLAALLASKGKAGADAGVIFGAGTKAGDGAAADDAAAKPEPKSTPSSSVKPVQKRSR